MISIIYLAISVCYIMIAIHHFIHSFAQVINPNSPWVRRWIYVLLVVAVYNSATVPFRVSFGREDVRTDLFSDFVAKF